MKKFKFTIRGSKYDVHIKDFEDNIAKLSVNGTDYDVEVHHEVKVPKTPKLVRKPVNLQDGGQTIKKVQSSGSTPVPAPLPGNIFKIMVKEGDTVKKGDKLLIMEAMKMENDVLSETDGTVSSLNVKEGDAVLQGDTLLTIG